MSDKPASRDVRSVPDELHFQDIMKRIYEGSEDAVWEFIETYGPHMRRYVRKQISEQNGMCARFDSVDFVQMVWLSFFTDREAMRSFASPNDVMRYLVRVTRNKFVSELRHSTAQKGGDIRLTHSLDALSEANLAPQADDKTPSHVAAARDEIAALLSQTTKRDRRIVEARMDGKTFVQIGEELRIGEQTARRAIWRLVQNNRETDRL